MRTSSEACCSESSLPIQKQRNSSFRRLSEAIETLKPRKPVIFAALDEGAPFDFPELEALRELGVACFPSPERAMRALAHVTRRAMRRPPGLPSGCAAKSSATANAGLLSEFESKQILCEASALQSPQDELAASPEEAVRIAADIGYPSGVEGAIAAADAQERCRRSALGITSNADLRDGVGRRCTQNVRTRAARADIRGRAGGAHGRDRA